MLLDVFYVCQVYTISSWIFYTVKLNDPFSVCTHLWLHTLYQLPCIWRRWMARCVDGELWKISNSMLSVLFFFPFRVLSVGDFLQVFWSSSCSLCVRVLSRSRCEFLLWIWIADRVFSAFSWRWSVSKMFLRRTLGRTCVFLSSTNWTEVLIS